MILRAEVRRCEADEIAIQAVEEGDDPRDQYQPDEEAAQLLVLDDRRNVNDVSFSQPYYDIKRLLQGRCGGRGLVAQPARLLYQSELAEDFIVRDAFATCERSTCAVQSRVRL